MNAKDKMRLDNSMSCFDFNHYVDYKQGNVAYTNGVAFCEEERAKLRRHISCCGFGAASFFVHRVSQTNPKDCLKFLESITNVLRVPKRGYLIIYIAEPGASGVERLIQFRIDTDGCLAIVGSTIWKEFVKEAKLKKNQLISLNNFKEMSRIFVCVAKLLKTKIAYCSWVCRVYLL